MDRIDILRNKMYEDGVDVVVITNSDYHQSEYSSDFFGVVEFFSGFTGSNATLVVSDSEAALFTDGRYFIQAENELSGSEIKLMKMGEPDVLEVWEYVSSLAGENTTVAFDGKVVSANLGIKIKESLDESVVINYNFDAAEFLWEDRPSLPKEKAWHLDISYSGETTESKISRIREVMSKKKVGAHVLTSLDDIAWILNIRGNDIAYNPVVMSYLIIEQSSVLWFVDSRKIDDDLKQYLQDNSISIYEYDEFYDELDSFNNERILLDKEHINYSIYEKLNMDNMCIYSNNPSVLMKSIKNDVELKNLRNVHVKDGVALTKFILWLKDRVGNVNFTEYDAALKLRELRAMQEGFIEESFETICAYKGNAAMMHYTATVKDAAWIYPEGMLLVDSGGQYLEGTTDVTRTIALGSVSDEEKKMFTLVLKGMFNLSSAKFLKGCTGVNLDILARQPLWNEGVDYRCGTGHGVSYLMSVHESPNAFRWRRRSDDCVLQAGMVTSDEPGVYVEGKYGIRTENEIECVLDEKNEYGQFLSFKTLTLVPIDTSLIDARYLSSEDIKRVNDYNEMVTNVLMPFLDENEQEKLKKYVEKIH